MASRFSLADTVGASFLRARTRPGDENAPPSYLNRKLSPWLESLSHRSVNHPIRTIVLILLLASTSYLRILESSLFDVSATTNNSDHAIDFTGLVGSARQLRLGPETSWKWQSDSREPTEVDSVRTLFFALTAMC